MSTVVIASVKRRGDEVIVRGTVDGSPAYVHLWFSYLQTFSTAAQKRHAIALALAATLPQETDLGLTGTETV